MSLPSIDDTNFYMTVGEIRSDVKKLLELQESNEHRLTSLERTRWRVGGAASLLGVFATTIIAKTFGFLH